MLSIKSLEVEPIAGVLQEFSIRVNKGVCPFDIAKVYANVNGTLSFIHGNRIRNPGCGARRCKRCLEPVPGDFGLAANGVVADLC